jgi:hypothetical protein
MNASKVSVGKLEGKRPLGRPDGSTNRKMWAGFAWLRTVTSGRL